MADMLRNDLAEQALLASIFNNPEIFGGISEIINPTDFYEPRNEILYSTVYTLYANGKKFDPVSVVGELQREGSLQKAGGTDYLRDILNPNDLTNYGSDPVGFALLVKEAARKRELTKAGESISQAASAGEGLTADDALQLAESKIVEIINREASSDSMFSLINLIPEAFDSYKLAGEMPEGAVRGIPTGLQQLDEMTNGFKGGELNLVAARPGVGKALNLESSILTTKSWKKIGEITETDMVFGRDGKPYKVIKAHEPILRDAYKITFSDHSTLIAGPEHEWVVSSRAQRKSRDYEKANPSQRNTILPKEKIEALQAELTKATETDLISGVELSRIIGMESPNPTMLRILQNLEVKEQITYRNFVRSVKVAEKEEIVKALETSQRNDFLTDAVLKKKITNLIHSLPTKTLSLNEALNYLFGKNNWSKRDYLYLTKLFHKRDVKILNEERTSQVKLTKKPILLYAKQEALTTYLNHATSILNDQRHEDQLESVKTTIEISDNLMLTDANNMTRKNYSIRNSLPLSMPEKLLPVAPYSLGAWLGDGIVRNGKICGIDWEVFYKVASEGYKILMMEKSFNAKQHPDFRLVKFEGLREALKAENLLLKNGHSVKEHGSPKRIPETYFTASESQRRELLAGLMDTDGTVSNQGGQLSFTTVIPELAEDVARLVSTLGYRPTITSKIPVSTNPDGSKKRNNKRAYTVGFSSSDKIFGLTRKHEIHQQYMDKHVDTRNNVRWIENIEPLGKQMWMRCLTVNSPDETFLVGERLIPTHNSTLAVDFGRAASFLAGKTVMMFSLEMGADEVTNRILSAEANVRLHDMKAGTLSELDWAKLEEARDRIAKSGGTFLIDANPKTTVSRIRSVCQRQKLKPEGLDMVIIDYLQLMESGPIRSGMSRENIVSEMSRSLKILAKELNVPLIVLSQLNRKSEERTDTRPQVSDLRESGSLEQDADIIFLIHRPEVTDSNNRPGEADLIIGKHRGGPTGKIPLVSMLEYSKFVPGVGQYAREPELLTDGESGEFGTTPDEIPW